MEAGSIPSNSVNVTLHGDAGKGVPVPLALLVADSRMIRDMCEGPELEKHITLVGVEVSTLKSYVTLLSSGGEIKIMNINRYSTVLEHSYLFSSHVNDNVGTQFSGRLKVFSPWSEAASRWIWRHRPWNMEDTRPA